MTANFKPTRNPNVYAKTFADFLSLMGLDIETIPFGQFKKLIGGMTCAKAQMGKDGMIEVSPLTELQIDPFQRAFDTRLYDCRFLAARHAFFLAIRYGRLDGDLI